MLLSFLRLKILRSYYLNVIVLCTPGIGQVPAFVL